MARVNIEDDIESRPQYRKLLKLVGGDDDRALGMLVRFWRHAQGLWGRGLLVPEEDMSLWEWGPLIESRWAIRREGGFCAHGAEKQFAWYRQRCESASAGGKIRASGPRDHLGRMLPQNSSRNPAGIQPDAGVIQPESSPPTPSPSPSPSQKKERKEKERFAAGSVAVATPAKNGGDVSSDEKPGGRLIREYILAYKQRYGESTRPDITGRTAGQVKFLLQSLPIERAVQLVQVYLQMDDKWFENKCHDFGTFIENLTKIGLALDTGQQNANAQCDIEKVLARKEVQCSPRNLIRK